MALWSRNLTTVMLARAQQYHDASLEAMLDVLDIDAIEASGVYFGVPCLTCKQDCLPIPIRGRDCCGFCETPVE